MPQAVPLTEGLGGCWLKARFSAELVQRIADGMPGCLVMHKVVRLWLGRQLAFNRACWNTNDFRGTGIECVDVRAAVAAEVAHHI